MASAANDRLFDAEVGHAVDLQQFSAWLVRRIIGLLNKTDADLFAQLTAALSTMPAESFTVDRLESLLVSVRSLNAQAYSAVGRDLTEQLREFASYEAGFQLQLFETVIPAQVRAHVGVAAVDIGQVEAAVTSRPFQGRLLREWASSIEADRMTRIRDTIRIGYVEGQTIDQIVRRVRGTRARGYADGIIEIDRRNAQAVVRTAVSHTAATAREKFYEANDDLIKAERWASTLDARTTPICQVRDGLQYTPDTHRPIGHSVPYLGGPGRAHWGCRSCGVPVLKSWRELGIPIDEIKPSTRASMDGQEPADTTYGDWLERQPAARQDEIVGPTRGALMRKGELPYDKLFDNRGQYLNLDELRARDASAFRRAGLE